MELEPVPVGDFDSDFVAVGFGFDSATDDYKVVAITYYDHMSKQIVPAPEPYAHVYSVKSGAWGTIGFPVSDYDNNGDWRDIGAVSEAHALYNGVVHWIMSRGAVFVSFDPDESIESGERFLQDLGTVILTFDLKSEVFGELDLPGCISDEDYPNVSISVVEDWLALLYCDEEQCTVYLMEDYGKEGYWVWRYKIQLPGPCVRPLCLRNEDELLVILEPGILAFLDTNATQKSYGHHSRISEWNASAFPCIESLVLVDKLSSRAS